MSLLTLVHHLLAPWACSIFMLPSREVLDHQTGWDSKISRFILVQCEHQLDNEASTFGKQHVIDTLESASDCERAFQGLDENGKMTEKKLRGWAGNLAKVPGNVEFFFEHRRGAWLLLYLLSTSVAWIFSLFFPIFLEFFSSIFSIPP